MLQIVAEHAVPFRAAGAMNLGIVKCVQRANPLDPDNDGGQHHRGVMAI